MNNLILLTDSYKVSHYKQYPPNSEVVYSYFESRGGEFDYTVFFGLQYFIKKYLIPGISLDDINEADKIYSKHLGPGMFNRQGWLSLLLKHGDKLPIKIKAVREGSLIGKKKVLMTVENTDPEFYWLTNYLETLLVQVWYPCTVATISREQKTKILNSLEKSGDPSLVDFKLHDFGCRGVETMESAMLGGMAHLVNFMGTDTVPAIVGASKYYGEEMAGFSIPAAEHSTITSWGKENEAEAYKNMLEQYGNGMFAVVSDSYNIYNACENIWGKDIKKDVLNMKGSLVIRPDSGDPTEVLPKILNILFDHFGGETNKKGYKVLNPKVRVIQGDGINRKSLQGILDSVMESGFSIDNIAFGSGGGLLQDCNRDTQKFAFKCSSITVDGKQKDVYKQPYTESWKASKRGRFDDDQSLIEVFNNGVLTKDYKLSEIREMKK